VKAWKCREGVRLDVIEDGGINWYAYYMIYLKKDSGSFNPKPWRCRGIHHERYKGTVRAQQKGERVFPVIFGRVFPQDEPKQRRNYEV